MTSFFKLSGGGNDFIALVEPDASPSAAQIVGWCRRGISLGADGVIALRRLSDAALEMRYWNSDGGEAALCLNGTRCAARLALHLGWLVDRGVVRTGAGDLAARVLGDGAIAVEAPRPGPVRSVTLETGDGAFAGYVVAVGVPHFVCFRASSVAEVPIERWAPALRRHPNLGPAGANVDFARVMSHRELELRSYERGVEGETLACGTGVLATAAAAVAAGTASLPLRAHTRGGFALDVLGTVAAGCVERWELAGDARVVAQGTLFAAAAIGADEAPRGASP
jgi:diaminopimelate epimerase